MTAIGSSGRNWKQRPQLEAIVAITAPLLCLPQAAAAEAAVDVIIAIGILYPQWVHSTRNGHVIPAIVAASPIATVAGASNFLSRGGGGGRDSRNGRIAAPIAAVRLLQRPLWLQ